MLPTVLSLHKSQKHNEAPTVGIIYCSTILLSRDAAEHDQEDQGVLDPGTSDGVIANKYASFKLLSCPPKASLYCTYMYTSLYHSGN